MAFQKLLMLSYELRSPSASRRASWTTTFGRVIGSEQHSALALRAFRCDVCGYIGVARGVRRSQAKRLFMARMTCDRGSDHARSIGIDAVLGAAARERVGSHVHGLRWVAPHMGTVAYCAVL